MTVIFALLSGYCADVVDNGFRYILNPPRFFYPLCPDLMKYPGSRASWMYFSTICNVLKIGNMTDMPPALIHFGIYT